MAFLGALSYLFGTKEEREIRRNIIGIMEELRDCRDINILYKKLGEMQTYITEGEKLNVSTGRSWLNTDAYKLYANSLNERMAKFRI